ncbi:MAG: GAF domain-containing protein [Prevotella sp.]|nr:GAF domain-containing protein [Prevotella sp.]
MEKKKVESYRLLVSQVKGLAEGETDDIGVMANVAAAIHQTMGFLWTGFYRVVGDELWLGPFQGPVACYRIPYGRGVCGTAWARGESVVVPDVEQFPCHIACSSLSRSEIVVPVKSADGTVLAVLDIDSQHLATFDETDRIFLEEICGQLAEVMEGKVKTTPMDVKTKPMFDKTKAMFDKTKALF